MEIVGRSSSHFTRVVRMFALDLEVAHTFCPVFDLTVTDAAAYAGNPALKIPILVDEHGPLFGTENICRVLAQGHAGVVLRGDVADRLVVNFEELVVHAMAADVAIAMARMTKTTPHGKLVPSLANSVQHLETHVDALLAALPARRLSFVEVALFCLVRHLPWREIMDTGPRLTAFADGYGTRASARETEFRFDQA
jgi:glutathione S-transferase